MSVSQHASIYQVRSTNNCHARLTDREIISLMNEAERRDKLPSSPELLFCEFTFNLGSFGFSKHKEIKLLPSFYPALDTNVGFYLLCLRGSVEK